MYYKYSASEVTTLWRYTNLFIIIIINIIIIIIITSHFAVTTTKLLRIQQRIEEKIFFISHLVTSTVAGNTCIPRQQNAHLGL